jgi:NADP-dependent 3-hydroxy acid dehydrogenase YdfG
MVNISSIIQSNKELDESTIPRVAVFVGGTAGIGQLTLGAITRLGTNFKAYIIGRKATEALFKPFLTELQEANPKARLIWIEGEVSLLSEVHRICNHIKSLETSIELLFMTTGYAPFRARQSTLPQPISQHPTLI